MTEYQETGYSRGWMQQLVFLSEKVPETPYTDAWYIGLLTTLGLSTMFLGAKCPVFSTKATLQLFACKICMGAKTHPLGQIAHSGHIDEMD